MKNFYFTDYIKIVSKKVMHTKYLQRHATGNELHDILGEFCIIALLC